MTQKKVLAADWSITAAIEHHRRGNITEAESICKRILKANPRDAEAHHLLGIIAYQAKHYKEAAEFVKRAIMLAGPNPSFLSNLGLACLALRDYDNAIVRFRHALHLNPGFIDARNNLGNVYLEIGRLEEATECYEKVLSDNGDSLETLYNMGRLCQMQGRFDEAIACYRRALLLRPDLPEPYNNLAVLHQELNRFDEAHTYCEHALSLDSGYAEAWVNLGIVLQEQGKKVEALRSYTRALELQPESVEARWGICMAQIPVLYDSPEEIPACRGRYVEELDRLDRDLALDDEPALLAAAKAVGSIQPYHLPYQGENDREPQRKYGRIVSRIQSARYPSWSRALPMPAVSANEKIRVGIVSGFFRHHSVWKMRIKGWLEHIDKERFDIYGYHTGKTKDDQTVIARDECTRFVEDVYQFERLCETIRNDDLHVLIYPEIGMDSLSLQLASLRLAPVQCSSWSHPETSGLPTIDYFLSSQLMEPPDGDKHYTERLVRLPNLGVRYVPLGIQAAGIDRQAFGLRQDAVVYLCAQYLPKYLPQHDEVLPRIAAQVGNCQFLFFGSVKSRHPAEQLRERLNRAFSRHGLRGDDHIVMLPHVDSAHYLAANQLCDVFLDSIGWSGMNTTLEAVACSLPVVTMPGKMMRGRHAYAVLKMMEVTETIAASMDEYVTIAARLGKDAVYRQQMAGLVAANRHRLYGDMAAIKALETFLEEAVRGFTGSPQPEEGVQGPGST